MTIDYADFSVPTLCGFLKARGLPHDGTKHQLTQRLAQHDATRLNATNLSARNGGRSSMKAPQKQSQATPQSPRSNASRQTGDTHKVMQTLNTIPEFTPSQAASSRPLYGSSSAPLQTQQPYATPPSPSMSQSTFSSTQHTPPASALQTLREFQATSSITPVASAVKVENNYATPMRQISKQPEFHTPPASIRQPPAQLTDSRSNRSKVTSNNSYSPLPAGQYLTYYELEENYVPYQMSDFGGNTKQFREIRRLWLEGLGVDKPPYQNIWLLDFKRAEVERCWAKESAEKRQHIEKKAIALKHGCLVEVPIRPVPVEFRDPPPIPFLQLEREYFDIPERKLGMITDDTIPSEANDAAFDAILAERQIWLSRLGLHEQPYHDLCTTMEEEVNLEAFYSQKTSSERRAVEAKANYLKAVLTPVTPTWAELEAKYEIYLRSTFTNLSTYVEKRREWLKMLKTPLHPDGLDIVPFQYIRIGATSAEADKEAIVVAWTTMPASHREAIENKAKLIKINDNPLLQTWAAFEAIYSFVDKKDPYFSNKTRQWLNTIGLTDGKELTSSYANEQIWQCKSKPQKEEIQRKAIFEKERFVRDKERQKVAKASGNYKAPEKPKPATRSSYRISRSSSYSSNHYPRYSSFIRKIHRP